jgi:hypothetical protein
VDGAGFVYVDDSYNARVQKFDSSGNFITQFAGYGARDGQLDFSAGLGVDSSGYVYVADTGNNRVQKFAEGGTLIVRKDADPDDPQDFTFTTGGGLSPGSFQLDDDGNESNALSSTRTFADVVPGAGYSVAEAPVAGWLPARATCSDGSPADNIDLAPGETVTCTFVNQHGYPRPKGATPTYAPLVLAYVRCSTPNRIHGGPLSYGSCNPPAQASQWLTVGTWDANARDANSIGSVKYRVVPGNPSTPADEADVQVTTSITDVRNKADLSDYAGELQVSSTLRMTDRSSGPAVDQPATVTDLSVPITVSCTPTADTSVGSNCALVTTLDGVLPGVVRERSRAIWEMGQLTVSDGGADGMVGTSGNGVFLRQGVFVP